MINKKLIRPRIMSDAFSRNMASPWGHPQVKDRMERGERYFVEKQEDGYSTTNGPMTREEAEKEAKQFGGEVVEK